MIERSVSPMGASLVILAAQAVAGPALAT